MDVRQRRPFAGLPARAWGEPARLRGVKYQQTLRLGGAARRDPLADSLGYRLRLVVN